MNTRQHGQPPPCCRRAPPLTRGPAREQLPHTAPRIPRHRPGGLCSAAHCPPCAGSSGCTLVARPASRATAPPQHWSVRATRQHRSRPPTHHRRPARARAQARAATLACTPPPTRRRTFATRCVDTARQRHRPSSWSKLPTNHILHLAQLRLSASEGVAVRREAAARQEARPTAGPTVGGRGAQASRRRGEAAARRPRGRGVQR